MIKTAEECKEILKEAEKSFLEYYSKIKEVGGYIKNKAKEEEGVDLKVYVGKCGGSMKCFLCLRIAESKKDLKHLKMDGNGKRKTSCHCLRI